MNIKNLCFVSLLMLLVALGCKLPQSTSTTNTNTAVNTATKPAKSGSPAMPPTTTDENSDVAISTAAPGGKDIPTPASGMGQIWGQVMYNSKPVEKIEVKLCENLSTLGGLRCDGKSFKTVTNASGEYLIQNVPPKTYGGVIVKVFNSNFYVYEATQFGLAKKYNVEADKTFYVNDTNLFKDDLKPMTPKAGSKVSGDGTEFTWAAYPDAAYYKLSVVWAGKDFKSAPYLNERVDGNTFKADKPIEPGTWYFQLEAYNDQDQKLSQSKRDYKFTIDGAVAPATAPPAK